MSNKQTPQDAYKETELQDYNLQTENPLMEEDENQGGIQLANPKHRMSLAQQQLASNDEGAAIEDGRETKFYFEKYRTIELCKCMLMLISQGMNILSYDLEFEQRDQTTNDLISYIIFITSIILMIMNISSYQVFLKYQIAAKIYSQKANLVNTGYWKTLTFSLFLYIVMPYPWTSGIKVHFDYKEGTSTREVYFYLNEILTLVMLIRIIFLAQSVLFFTRYAGSRPNRVCQFYACKSNGLFIFKCMMRKYPFTVFWALYISSIFFFGFAIRIAERVLVRKTDQYWQDQKADDGHIQFDQDFNSYSVALWCVFVSLPTVGYGDRFPRTVLGRSILTICAVLGAFFLSILLNALDQTLQLSEKEGKSMTVIERVWAKLNLKNAASNLILYWARVVRHCDGANKTLQPEGITKDKANFHEASKTHSSFLSQYKNIQNSYSLYEQLEQEFEILRKDFVEFQTRQNHLMKCDQQLTEFIETYVPNTKDMQLDELESNHLQYFDGLEQANVETQKYDFNYNEKEIFTFQ